MHGLAQQQLTSHIFQQIALQCLPTFEACSEHLHGSSQQYQRRRQGLVLLAKAKTFCMQCQRCLSAHCMPEALQLVGEEGAPNLAAQFSVFWSAVPADPEHCVLSLAPQSLNPPQVDSPGQKFLPVCFAPLQRLRAPAQGGPGSGSGPIPPGGGHHWSSRLADWASPISLKDCQRAFIAVCLNAKAATCKIQFVDRGCSLCSVATGKRQLQDRKQCQ